MARECFFNGPRMKSRLSVLYLFPHSMREVVAEVESGMAPTERMYGVVELRRLGFNVDICDSRFEGLFGRICIFFRRYGIFLLDWNTLLEIFRHDILIVKDDFSVLATFAAKLFRKKIIYLDAMFNVPRRRWRRWLTKICILASDAIVAYSRKQIKVWSREFNVPDSRFTFFPYALDVTFYKKVSPMPEQEPYVMAIGRDMGRDFATLVEAMKGTNIKLKLVTLPYLLPPGAVTDKAIEVLERVTYQKLFELYAGALLVVVPLKDAIFYPSGIRAVLESALLEKVTVATQTSILEEYLQADKEVIYVKPRDAELLRAAIISLAGNEKKRHELERGAKHRVLAEYGMDAFAGRLVNTIEMALGRRQ